MQDEIKIKFTADGGNLLKEINKLDQATKKLLNTQVKITSFSKKQQKSNDKTRATIRRLRGQLELQGKTLKDLNLPLRVYRNAIRGSASDLAKIQVATKKHTRSLKEQNRGLLDTSHNTRILGGAFSVLRSKLLLVNFALGLGIRQLSRFVATSAKIESMQTAFNTLSGSTEVSSEAFEKLQIATDGTMSKFDLFQQANNAMILGVTKNSDEMAEMFDTAQRLGKALGRDTASSVESLITGIGRQSRLMLDNIGIIVKSEEAYERYAEKLKITTNQLTDAQKKQAFLEATLEATREAVEKLPEEVGDAQDSFDRLKASSMNLAGAIGSQLSPAFSVFSGLTSDFFDLVSKSLNKFVGLEKAQKSLAFQQNLLNKLTETNLKENKGLIAQTEKRIAKLKEEIEVITSSVEVEKDKELAKKKLEKAREQELNRMNKVGDMILENAKRRSILNESIAEELELAKTLLEIQEESELRQKTKEHNDAKELLNSSLLLKKIKEKTIAQNKNFHSLDFLDSKQKFAVDSARNLSSAFADATLNGQNMGKAVVASLKAIASELIAQAGVYALLNVFTGGAFGGATSFFKFVTGHTGGFKKEDGNIQRFATGGRVQGQDNVPILAQAGEFIMSKQAVESIGLETLNQMNQSGMGGGVTVNIHGGVVDESYVSNELIPAINKATSLGARVNA